MADTEVIPDNDSPGGKGESPIGNLLGPIAENVGLILGQLSDVLRFYSEQNLISVFTKWAEQRHYRAIDAEEFKRVMPLLRDAAMQGNTELQDRWAALLESTASGKDGVLPSFGQTLSQLTVEEARYLDRVWKAACLPRRMNVHREGRAYFSFENLTRIYDRDMRAPSPAEMRLFRDRMTPQQVTDFAKMTKLELTLNDLERLGLLIKEVQFIPGDETRYEIGGESLSVPSGGGSRTVYALTQYGVNFIQAVKPRTEQQ